MSKTNELTIGQGWALDASDGIPPILVFIHSLETFEHVRVAGISIEPHPQAKEQGWPDVSHLPVKAESLWLEAGKLVITDQTPTETFWNGYNTWLEKFQAGEAGVFEMSALECYKLVVGVSEDFEDGES